MAFWLFGMATDSHNEALESLQKLWNASVIIILVWLLFLPGALEQLKEYDAALQLTTWRLLFELTKILPLEANGDYLKEGYISSVPMEAFVGQPPPHYGHPLFGMVCFRDTEGTDDCNRPLVVQTNWPEQSQIGIFLSTELFSSVDSDDFDGSRWTPRSFSKLTRFKVISTPTELPFQTYIISRVVNGDERYLVGSVDDKWTKVADPESDIPTSRPLHEQEILSYVGVDSVTDITSDQLRKFQEAADLSHGTLSIAGLNLNVGFSFAGIGILLAAVAFLMLGPLLVLGVRTDKSESATWTLAVCTRDRPLLEVILFAIWSLWAISPILIGITQVFENAPLPIIYRGIRGAGMLGLVFASYLFIRATIIFRALRLASTP